MAGLLNLLTPASSRAASLCRDQLWKISNRIQMPLKNQNECEVGEDLTFWQDYVTRQLLM
jgi:hypothetical protein